MQAPKAERDLLVIRQNGSTTRVWNLMLVAERHGSTIEYRERPVFRSRRLNRTLIVKETLPPHETDLLRRGGPTATKVILPYALDDLRVGGESFYVRQSNLDRVLKDGVGGYAEPGSIAMDMETLAMLEALPSLDPFLVRERMKLAGRNPARCFFEIAEADVERMRTFVANEITSLVAMAFDRDDVDARALAARLADKLMTDENAEALAPLKSTLRLSGEEYSEGVFAWKGFLYYKWLVGDIAPQVEDFNKEVRTLRPVGATAEERSRLAQLRDRVLDLFRRKLEQVRASISEFDAAFDLMTGVGRADAFRAFVLNAPRRFSEMGENVGIVSHIHTYWRYRFPPGRAASMPCGEAFRMFEEFEQTLGATPPKRAL